MAKGDTPSGSGPAQHPLVEALVPDPSQPPEKSGRSATTGTLRLYLTETLDEYVEVPEADVLHARELPDDGGTQVWVRARASVQHVRVESQQLQAEFLAGSIAEGYVAASAAEMAGSGLADLRIDNRTNYCGGRPTTRCPSERRCPTEEFCPDVFGPRDVGTTISPTTRPRVCPTEVMPGGCPTSLDCAVISGKCRQY